MNNSKVALSNCCCSVAKSSPTLLFHGLWHARLPCPSWSLSLPKFMSIAWVMPSSHLMLWHPLLRLPSIFPSIRDFSNELAVCIRWPKYWSFSFSPFNEYSELISLRLTGLISLLSKGLSGVFSSNTVWRHQFFGALPSLLYYSWQYLDPESAYIFLACRNHSFLKLEVILRSSKWNCFILQLWTLRPVNVTWLA